jgi:hypothetical protein
MFHVSGTDRTAARWASAIIVVLAGVVALTLRLYFVTHAQVLQAVDQESVRGDASQYYDYAWNIVHRGVFSSALPSEAVALPDSYRDPGYPLLLALAMRLTDSFDTFYACVLIAQAILGAATVTLLVLAARHWLPPRPLAVVALIMAVWPHSLSIPAYLLTETLTGFLCAAAFVATEYASRNHKPSIWAVAGAAWSLAGMTNAVLLPFAALLAILLYLRLRIDRRAALALALASLVLPAGWTIRSTTLPTGASSTSRAVTNFVQGSWPSYHDAFRSARHRDFHGTEDLRLMQTEMDALQARPRDGFALMFDRMRVRPLAYVGWYMWKPALLWAWDIRIGQGDIYIYPTRDSPLASTGPLWVIRAACYLANPAILALMILGIVLTALDRDSDVVASSAAALVLFVTLIYSALQSEPRYAIPFRGVEMLLAARGALYLKSWAHNRSKKVRHL